MKSDGKVDKMIEKVWYRITENDGSPAIFPEIALESDKTSEAENCKGYEMGYLLDLPAIERIKRKACPCWRCSGFGSYDAGTCPTCSGTGVDGEEWAKLVKGESDAH